MTHVKSTENTFWLLDFPSQLNSTHSYSSTPSVISFVAVLRLRSWSIPPFSGCRGRSRYHLHHRKWILRQISQKLAADLVILGLWLSFAMHQQVYRISSWWSISTHVYRIRWFHSLLILVWTQHPYWLPKKNFLLCCLNKKTMFPTF